MQRRIITWNKPIIHAASKEPQSPSIEFNKPSKPELCELFDIGEEGRRAGVKKTIHEELIAHSNGRTRIVGFSIGSDGYDFLARGASIGNFCKWPRPAFLLPNILYRMWCSRSLVQWIHYFSFYLSRKVDQEFEIKGNSSVQIYVKKNNFRDTFITEV